MGAELDEGVVRDLGVNTFGSGTPTGNSTSPGNADINLRGLGSDNTLVLLNGQRLPQDAITGTVDINLIPIAAVERVEILKDGASAIYGSDALGGVVNIITRKDFSGTEINASQSIPTNDLGGKGTKVSLVNGINGEKLNVVTSLGYRYDQAINSRDRPWSDHSFSQIGNPGSYANIDPTNGDGLFMASPNCPVSSRVSTPSGTYCQFKYSDYSQETPQISQIGGMSEAHYELNSQLRFTGRVNYTHRNANTIAAASPASPGQLIVPAASVAQFNLPGTVSGDALDVQDRLTALGPRITNVTTNAYGGLLGTTIQLPKDWAMDITTTSSIVKNSLEGTSGYAKASLTQALITSGAYNPFATPGLQGSIASAAYVPTEATQTSLYGLEVKASGDLMQTSAGPIGLAVGSLMNFSSYSDVTDNETLAGNVLGNAGSSGAGHRTTEALYSELSIPVVKKKLELQLAGRYDHYSDFGGTVNPKAGFLYHVSSDLLVRGSVGTGFRAPLLTELYAGQSVGFPSFIDYVACARYPGTSACQAQQYQVSSGGNPGLKQETPNANIGLDWFYTKISNMPGIDYNDMTLAQLNGANVAKAGVIITRDPSSGIIQSVVAPLQNLSSEDEMGVDVTGSYVYKKFKFATEQNQLFYYKIEGFPGAGLTNKLGWNGMPAWRNTSSVSYTITDVQDVSMSSHTIPSQKTLDKSGYISPLTTFDLFYTYKTKKIGSFSLALINLLNSQPPLDSSDPQSMVNYSLYDPNGRQIVLGYRVAL